MEILINRDFPQPFVQEMYRTRKESLCFNVRVKRFIHPSPGKIRIQQRYVAQGQIQKIQKGVARTLASYIETIYFTENSLKIVQNFTKMTSPLICLCCHGMHYGLTSLCGDAEVDWFGEPGLEHSISPPAFSTER